MDWCGVDYLWFIVIFYQPFGLSFLQHPFMTEDSLASKWSTVMLNFSKAVQIEKQTQLGYILCILGFQP